MEIMNLIKTVFFFFGMIIFFSCILPPIHLIFDKDREKKEKELKNMINLENMTRKQQLNLFGKIFLGAVLMAIPFLKF
ncbi:TPA: hypothetical protein ACPO1V_001752 [Haemophilus influenzae]|uniref:hypothetical protein n=1 Tax=Haemophilus influenzae TaxID=727 RepID=UPI000DD32551|nr:hypothetical protein [Haemophilus influenzae]